MVLTFKMTCHLESTCEVERRLDFLRPPLLQRFGHKEKRLGAFPSL